MNRLVVLFIQRRLPHYRVPLFDLLRIELSKRNVRLVLAHGQPNKGEAKNQDSGNLPWTVDAPNLYLPFGLSVQLLPWNLVVAAHLVVVPHEQRNLCAVAVVVIRKLLRRPVALFGHGDNFQNNRLGWLQRWLRLAIAKLADGWFCYTAASRDRLINLGVAANKIFTVNNTTDTSSIEKVIAQICRDEEHWSPCQGSSNRCRVIYIGSLHKYKRIDFLLEAIKGIKERIPEFTIDIVGDGPEAWRVTNASVEAPWIRWHGHLSGSALAQLGGGAVAALNPGMVGLGIVDAFAMRLPTITTDCGIHSPEIAYLENGSNGLIVPDNIEAFVDAVVRVLSDPLLQTTLANGCASTTKQLSIQAMASRFVEGFEQLLAQAPSRKRVGVPPTHPEATVVIIWQRFLDYHIARLEAARVQYPSGGEVKVEVIGIQVATSDLAYGFSTSLVPSESAITLFRGWNYHELSSRQIVSAVDNALRQLSPDLVLCPATAFPEGMAAIRYGMRCGARVVIMDDAWEETDFRGIATRAAKRVIHRSVDGCFIPDVRHSSYFRLLGIPADRHVFGVDVVDNSSFSPPLQQSISTRPRRFLFVGRFIERKGIGLLVEAYARYRKIRGPGAWELRLVGDGPLRCDELVVTEGITWAGIRIGPELREEYWSARCLVVPSLFEQWGLAINEACAAGLVVIAGDKCGAALTLVENERNGWLFTSGSKEELVDRMLQADRCEDSELESMSAISRILVTERAPLENFAKGVVRALELPKRPYPGPLTELAVCLWNGRVSIR